MTLKEIAHLAQQILQRHAGCPVKHSHVHELFASAFGYRSWAAFRATALFADAGVGTEPSSSLPLLIGRATQLGYPAQTAIELGRSLVAFMAEHRLSCLTWSVLSASLMPSAAARLHHELDSGDGAEEGEEDDAEFVAPLSPSVERVPRERLLQSSLLRHNLELAANGSDPRAHFLLASLLRCRLPNAYLYEESLKGRVLTAVERGWVEEYLRLAPQYRSYEAHLKAAALGGIRAAALEYGTTFESTEFLALAEQLDGPVDAEQMARRATTPQSRLKWLSAAAQNGSQWALEKLADQGDVWAEEVIALQMVRKGDARGLRYSAERALADGDGVRAWVWQYLAISCGMDLTHSTLAAYHDGGHHDGEFYDSDFGGPLYVGGDEGLVLPDLSRSEHEAAKLKAQEMLGRLQ